MKPKPKQILLRAAFAYTALGYLFIISSFFDTTFGAYIGTINELVIFVLSIKFLLLGMKKVKMDKRIVSILLALFLLINV